MFLKICLTFVLLKTFLVFSQSEPPLTEIPPDPLSGKGVSLKDILDQGLRENRKERASQLEQMMLEIKKKGVWESYWFPHVGLVVENGPHKVSSLSQGEGGSRGPRTPSGRVGVAIDDYTLFNWNIDYFKYKNSYENYQREQEKKEESKSYLKHSLVYLYFFLVKEKNREFFAREQVRHATFLYRLAKEKLMLNKISKQNYFEIKNLYLIKQQEFNLARMALFDAQKRLAIEVGDEAKVLYAPTEVLKYLPLRFTLSEALALYKSSNSYIKDKQLSYENAKRDYERSKYENLPLPKISLSLGSYASSFSSSSSQTVHDQGNNIEVRAAISLKWDLIGEKGLFNDRPKTYAFYEKSKTMIERDLAISEVERDIRQYYNQILEQQRQMELLTAFSKSGKNQFEETLKNYLADRSSFMELKEALSTLYQSESLLEESKLLHLKQKITLCELIGIEDFPNDLFENLGTKEDGL